MGVWAEGRAQPCEEPRGGRAVVTAYDANTQLSPSCRCAEEPGCWAGPSALCGRVVRENWEDETKVKDSFYKYYLYFDI